MFKFKYCTFFNKSKKEYEADLTERHEHDYLTDFSTMKQAMDAAETMNSPAWRAEQERSWFFEHIKNVVKGEI